MSSARPRQNRLLGIALRICAIACFALMAALIKLGHGGGVSTVELVFYRSIFGLPPLLAWIVATRNFGAWRTKRPLAHIWRGSIGLTAMALGFAALGYLPLAEATTISFAAPLFAVILSALFLNEKIGAHRWSAVAAGFAGVVIVMQPQGSHLPPAGLALALLGALATSVAAITIRQVGRTEGTQTIVLWFGLLTASAAGLLMPFYGQLHSGRVWLILAALGMVGGTGQIFLTASLRYAPVSVVVPFDYLQLLWAVLLGWLIFASHPPATTWAGAAVIIASGLYTLYREHRLGRDKAREAPALQPL
jgi:drug/metabolite transporter (DMT)-like permease